MASDRKRLLEMLVDGKISLEKAQASLNVVDESVGNKKYLKEADNDNDNDNIKNFLIVRMF